MQGQGNYFVIDYNDLINPNNFEWIRDNAVVGKLYLIENYSYNDEKINLLLTCVENSEISILFRNGNSGYTLELKNDDDFEVIDNLTASNGIYVLLYYEKKSGGGWTLRDGENIYKKLLNAYDNNLNVYGKVVFFGNVKYIGQLILSKSNTLDDLFIFCYDYTYALYNTDFPGTWAPNLKINVCGLRMQEKGYTYVSDTLPIMSISADDMSWENGSFGRYEPVFSALQSASDRGCLIQFAMNFNDTTKIYTIISNVYGSYRDGYTIYGYIEYGKRILIRVKNDNTYTVETHTDFLPTYNTLQVSGIESIAINSSITTSIQSLTDKNTIITSIKPSVAGVIVSAPYYDETDSCYKTTIFNSTTSEVSDLTLTIDYYTLTQD